MTIDLIDVRCGLSSVPCTIKTVVSADAWGVYVHRIAGRNHRRAGVAATALGAVTCGDVARYLERNSGKMIYESESDLCETAERLYVWFVRMSGMGRCTRCYKRRPIADKFCRSCDKTGFTAEIERVP